MTTPLITSAQAMDNAFKTYAAPRVAAVQTQLAASQSTVTTQQAQIAALQAQLAAAGPGRAPALPTGWVLVGQDEFNGSLNPAMWTATTDTASNELSARTPANVIALPDRVRIQARRQALAGRQFSSGYITTDGKCEVTGAGKWLIRARWDDIFAMWPALWLRFPGVGEVDMTEGVGTWRKILQTAHQNTSGTQDKSGYEWVMPVGWNPSDFHVYGIERRPDGTLIWTVDSSTTRVIGPNDLSTKLHQPMSWLSPSGPEYAGGAHLIINQQVGGSLPNYYLNGGQPIDPATILPGSTVANLDIDWVQISRPA